MERPRIDPASDQMAPVAADPSDSPLRRSRASREGGVSALADSFPGRSRVLSGVVPRTRGTPLATASHRLVDKLVDTAPTFFSSTAHLRVLGLLDSKRHSRGGPPWRPQETKPWHRAKSAKHAPRPRRHISGGLDSTEVLHPVSCPPSRYHLLSWASDHPRLVGKKLPPHMGKARRRYRSRPQEPAPTFAEVHDLSVYARDDTAIRASTLTLDLGAPSAPSDYLRTPAGTRPAWCDDSDDESSLRYAFAKSALEALQRGPRDEASSRVQRLVRGQIVRRRLALLARARARWKHRDLSKAFQTWTKLSRTLGVAAFSLAAVVGRLMNARLAASWRSWIEDVAEGRRHDALKKRVLARLHHGKWYRAAFRSWRDFVLDARKVAALVQAATRQWMFSAFAMTFRTWLAFVEAAHQARTALLVRRVAVRLFNSGLDLCARAFYK